MEIGYWVQEIEFVEVFPTNPNVSKPYCIFVFQVSQD